MNALLLVMSSTLASGGDVVPAGWGEKAYPQATHATASDSCCPSAPRASLLDRLKNRFGLKSSCDCQPAPTPSCNTCGSSSRFYQPNLLDKIKSRWGSKNSCCCDPCAGATPTTTPPAGETKPKVDPKPKEGGKSAAGTIQPQGISTLPLVPSPGNLPTLPTVPGQSTLGEKSPY
jgi:hypothetical protein